MAFADGDRVGVLGKLFSRPKTEYIGKVGEEDLVLNPQPSDLLFISKCENCKFSIRKRAAKCIIESCKDLRLELQESLISGMLEMIDCDDVTLTINPQEPLPTLSAERCKNLQLYFYEPSAMGSIYTIKCPKIFIHFQPPHTERNEVVLKTDGFQYVTKYVEGQFTTALVVREGAGYATTKDDILKAEKKELELQHAIEDYLGRLITIKPKEQGQAPPQDDKSSS